MLPDTSPMQAALDQFLGSPTQDHQTVLNNEANAFREAWIAEKAGGASKARPFSRSKNKYDREASVSKEIDGAVVRLALQERTNSENSWWVMSWRTTVASSGRNRRFYFMRDQFWSMPANDALDLMHEIQSEGAFKDQYRDARDESDLTGTVSTKLDPEERDTLLEEITHADEDWGNDPFFVIVDDPHEDWRKVMIVNRETNELTFRSVTKNATYRPRKELHPGHEWQLDNTMMDANIQQMRHFLRELETFLSQ